ncbi:MAG: hypothetical protein HIU88_12920 [Acidobacteria bacterium]|nr:hypothetical protein [Acidobacteriota bacterium]
MFTRRARSLGGALLVGLALTACSTGKEQTVQPSASGSPTSTALPTPLPTSPAPAPTSVATSPSTPTAPSNPPPRQVLGLVAVTGGGSGEVLLTWTQNSESDVVSYIVFRAVSSGGPLTQLGTMTRQDVTQFPIRPFVDSEAQVDYYRVRAVDSAAQQGPLSVEVCGAAPGFQC